MSPNLSSAAVVIVALWVNRLSLIKTLNFLHRLEKLIDLYEPCISNFFFEGGGGVQWLSGRVLDSRPRSRGFEPHRHHCVVVLEQDTFILA